MAPFNTTATPQYTIPTLEKQSTHPLQSTILLAAGLLAATSCFQTIKHYNRPSSSTQTKRWSTLGVLAGVLLYCYLADRTSAFNKLSKQHDEPIFLLLCVVALLAGAATVRGHASSTQALVEKSCSEIFELLPRQLTEEWKGWMQIVILLYHYFGMSKILHIYRVIRLLVGSYLFLTGYGHTVYFLRTNDFTFRRVAFVLLRLNLLACVLPFVMGTTYDLYYFPALSTFWFLVTWITIPRASKGALDMRKVISRVLAACLTTEILLSMPAIWASLASALRSVSMVDIDAHELIFRLSLDRYITYVGMLAACLSEHISRSQNASSIRSAVVILSRRRLTIGLCALAAYFMVTARTSTKQGSNRLHAITEPIPILILVPFRSSTPFLRLHHSRLFAWFGRYSLETFILQYHIWLAADTKKLLSLGFLYQPTSSEAPRTVRYWIETCLITALFLVASFLAANATSFVTACVVGHKSGDGESAKPQKQDLEQTTTGGTWRLAKALHQLSLKQRLTFLLGMLWLMNMLW